MQNLGKLFTYMDVIGGKIFSNKTKNLNDFHKDSKDLVSVIITLGEINKWIGHCVFIM